MPRKPDHFPTSMKYLPPAMRDKAIDAANALLDEGMGEGMAIRLSLARAKEWGRHRRPRCAEGADA